MAKIEPKYVNVDKISILLVSCMCEHLVFYVAYSLTICFIP
jgi:hypothetical protein